MDASCKIQRSIHDVRLTYKYVSRILGTYHPRKAGDYFRSQVKDQPSIGSTFCSCILTLYSNLVNSFIYLKATF